MLALGVVHLLAHVPTYEGGEGQCIKPPHAPTTSQVIYLTLQPGTTGGLEYHCPDQATCAIDFTNGQLVDWDFTFKERYPTSTYRITVGCVGCVASDPVTIPPVAVQYGHGTVEPFSTTRYYSLTNTDKKYNSSLLDPSVCPHAHFGVRIDTYANATTMRVGVVVGLGESFTIFELLSFPVYVILNHGANASLKQRTAAHPPSTRTRTHL